MIKGVLIIRKVSATINLQDPSFKVSIKKFFLYYLSLESFSLHCSKFHLSLSIYLIIKIILFFIGNKLIKGIFSANDYSLKI